ncbi:tetratricopeptide repeat protein [Fulvivirga maritima]|uniref:tetratricopeptide repeat protein n=1 Tax=Fulvivirga maritima TaxID=2904247 RepID=UPI001F18DDDF|nr:tetratricopeptide repeat protein [Fulvivirga maritima]UII29111.1 tetratricopeptide repeat protein [Fulvivirga maritima]
MRFLNLYKLHLLSFFILINLCSCSNYESISPEELPSDQVALEALLNNENSSNITRLMTYDKLSYIYEKEDLDKTIQVLEKQLALSKELENKTYEAKALIGLGVMKKKKRDYTGAINAYIKAAHINEEMSNPIGVANCENNIGVVFIQVKGYNSAIEHFNKASQIYQDLEKNRHLPRIYTNIALCYAELNENTKAISQMKEAIELQSKVEPDNSARIGYLYNELGRLYYINKDYKKAIETYNQALAVKDISEEMKFAVYHGLANSYMYQGTKFYDIAADYIEKSKLLENHTEISEDTYIKSMNVRGEFLQLTGQHEEALQLFTNVINYADNDNVNAPLTTTLDLASNSLPILANAGRITNEQLILIQKAQKQQQTLKEQLESNLNSNSIEALLNKEIENYYLQVKEAKIKNEHDIFLKVSGLIVTAVLLVFSFLLILTYKKKKKYKEDHFIVEKIKSVFNEYDGAEK